MDLNFVVRSCYLCAVDLWFDVKSGDFVFGFCDEIVDIISTC